MNYIAIRRDAAEEIIAERSLQSTDFDEGVSLARALINGSVISAGPRIANETALNGLIIYGPNSAETRYVVIDLKQSGLFLNQSAHNVVLFIQRTLRFSIKYWDRGVLTPAERVVGGRTAAIFPFPLSQKTGFRVTIDLNPDVERLAKRNMSGRFLLVYKAGTEEGGGANETASISTFRRFLDDLVPFEAAKKQALLAEAPGHALSGLTSTTLTDLDSQIDIHQNYETWSHRLTTDQRRFAYAPLIHPARIDGPAGTGKTASLAFSAVHALKVAAEGGLEFQSIFLTHSEASRRSISTVLHAMGATPFMSEQSAIRNLRVQTLQGYCAEILRQDLSATEFVDPDAYDAKQLQSMYVEEALRQVEPEFASYKKFMSPELLSYIEDEDPDLKTSLIQHEIAVVIKGRARENLDTYKLIPSIPSGLPVRTAGDKGFLWRIYEIYRGQLVAGGQFDTDDVVLTALSQLSTPIWRRRRVRDGFDAIYVDETHLFNMNELSIFHQLTRSEDKFPIAFAVDRSQAIGDRGWTDDIDVTSLMPVAKEVSDSLRVNVNGIFRSSPDIVNLAFTITSSGASLFTNFQDPMLLAHSNMGYAEEKRASPPKYVEFVSDESMIDAAFSLAETMKDEMSSSRGGIAVVAFSDELFHTMERLASEHNKPFEVLKHRGDEDVVRRAKGSERFVLSLADYIGGLEFDGIILVGVDKGRVPPVIEGHAQSRAYMSFAAHNKLYVAVTRARYRVMVLGVKERGPSEILRAAFVAQAIT
ncbi:UvrD-helicase domain-containing protein [Sphingosinicellaceae bacterium]|nr:UvrD-helicase domain-containing protein [Sphingosinicellaceae bacterium]